MTSAITERYDLIAIGAGPAGESATELAAFFGYRSVVIEKNRPGGTVTTTGGAPTKTLREAALYLTGFQNRDIYGLRLAAPPDIVLPAIGERTRRVCALLQQATADNIAMRNVDYIQGIARLGPDRTVLVTSPDGAELKLEARSILIAAGSRPIRPKNFPFDDPGVCDSDTILARGRMPKEILIVGAGPIGVEFATVCHALGARVTLTDLADRLMPMMDGEMSDRMAALFREWGVTVVLGAATDAIVRVADKLEVSLSNGAKLFPDTVLFAAGRVANTEDLGLDAAGVQTDARGRIVVDPQFRTSAEGIFAAGDVLGPTLASIAMEQGRAAACYALGIPLEGTVDPTPVSAVYGMPEVAGAGLTEDECRSKGLNYEVGRSEFDLTPRGAISGHGGLLKLIFLKDSRKLVGVHCIGEIASELVTIGQMVIHFGGTINTFAEVSLNTPTYGYAYKYAAFDGLRRLAEANRGAA